MATKFNPITAAPAADDPKHPFFGQGGSYFFDPATGQTTLRARSGQAPENANPQPAAANPQPNTPQE